MGDDAPPMGGVATASRPALLDAGLWLRPATWPHWVSVLARHGWIALALAFSVATAGRLWDLTAGAGSRIQALYGWIPDIAQFSGLGESVLRGDLGGAYADPFNQAGPAQIIGDGLVLRLLAVLPGAAGVAVLMTLVASVPLLVGGSVAASLIRRLPDSSTLVLAAPWLTVAVLGLIGADEEYLMAGHWWQIPVLLLWVLAGGLSAAGRPVLAGAAIGLATGLEPWGIVGVVALLLAPDLRRVAGAVGAAVAVSAMLWLPFVVSGSFHMAGYHWTVRADSVWSLLVGAGSPFPWSLRLLQAGLVGAVATAVTLLWARPLLRRHAAIRATACLLVPVIIVLLRVATDIWFGSYYLISPVVVLLPAAVIWALHRNIAGAWLMLASWLVLMGAAGRGPFALSAAACVASVAGLFFLRDVPLGQEEPS